MTTPNFHSSLRRFSVELGWPRISPHFINPDTLKYNNIVGKDWVCSPGVSVGLLESSFEYDNGVSVEAVAGSVTFEHTDLNLVVNNVVTAQIAERYVSAFNLHNELEDMAFVFWGALNVPDNYKKIESLKMSAFYDSMIFGGAPPQFKLGVNYSYENKYLSVDLWTDNDDIIIGGRIVHWLNEEGDREQIVHSTLREWTSAWNDIVGISNRLIAASQQFRGA